MTGRADAQGPRSEALVARLARELVEQGRRSARREAEQDREIERLRARVDELARDERRARRRASRLEARLDEVHRSSTWRAGEAVLWLPKRARTLARARRRDG